MKWAENLIELKGRFNLRTKKNINLYTNLYFVINYNGKQLKLPTEIKVKPSQWNTKKQLAQISYSLTELENRYNKNINKLINKYILAFNECKEYICDNPNEIENLSDLLYNYCCGMKKLKTTKINALIILRELIINRQIADASKRMYLYELDSFIEFLKKDRNINCLEWEEIDIKLIKDYKKYLQNKKVKHDITEEYVCELDETIKGKITYLSAILNMAAEEEYITKLDLSIVKKQATKKKSENNQVALTEEEINKIWNAELTGLKDKIRDLFVFQLYTAQRYSHINGIELDKANPEIRQGKTGIIIPIAEIVNSNNRVKEILEKYNYKLPKVSIVSANNELKIICKELGFNDNILCSEMRGGKEYVYNCEKWKLIGTHTSRRTFITQSVKKGVPNQFIKALTGHETDEMLNRYTRLTREEGIKELSNRLNTTKQVDSDTLSKHIKELADNKFLYDSKTGVAIYNNMEIPKEITTYEQLLSNVYYKITRETSIEKNNSNQYIKELNNAVEKIKDYRQNYIEPALINIKLDKRTKSRILKALDTMIEIQLNHINIIVDYVSK